MGEKLVDKWETLLVESKVSRWGVHLAVKLELSKVD
jgi:hypothetical protein